jgi:hypothetical protein
MFQKSRFHAVLSDSIVAKENSLAEAQSPEINPYPCDDVSRAGWETF